MGFPILSTTLFVPLLGALFILAVPREYAKVIRRLGLIFALLALGLAITVLALVQADGSQMWYESADPLPWIAAFNVFYRLGADGLSAPLLLLTALVTLLVLFYSARTVEVRVKEYFSLFLILETSLFGVFLSVDLVLFYGFWVLGLVPLLLLIGIWGGQRRERAAIKLFLVNLLGSVALLLVILAVYSREGTFDVFQAAQRRPYADQFPAACVAMWALFFAFAVRMPSFPFHTWLSDAQTEAPTGVSVALAGAFLSTGGYGMMRIALPLFPDPFRYFVTEVWVLPALAVVSIVYGALVCLAQWDLKRLISCSSLAQMGFVTLGVCAAAASYGDDLDAASSGLTGAAMQMFAHSLVAGALLFLVGMLYRRTHTYDVRAFGGLAKRITHTYGLMLVLGLAAAGLPGLIGFWGELFVFKSAVGSLPVFAFVSVLGVLFTAGTTLAKILQRIFLGPLDEERWGQLEDLAGWEKVTVWPLLILVVVLGFYPAPVLDLFNQALTTLLKGLP